MNFDYLAYNTLGHSCYLVYNIGLFMVPSIINEYHKRNPFVGLPVEANDLVFPINAVISCAAAALQCCFLEVTLFNF